MKAGDVLKAPYVLEEFIGRGGQGECWLVREQPDLQAAASLAAPGSEGKQWLAKLYPLHREGWEPYDLVEREATLLRQLHHPGIPAFRDMFLLPEGPVLCLIREWLPGENLEQRVADHRFSAREVRQIGIQLLDILIYIHGLSPALIHRDIKPSNVIIKPDGAIALIDFGSVRDAIYQGERMSVMGTYGYTPPEQFLGHPTPASDLYALGATMIYLLSRQHPSTLPLERNRLQFESYVNVQPRFLRILQQLLAPTVEGRCQSAEEAKAALLRCDEPSSVAEVLTQESIDDTLSRAATSGLQRATAPRIVVRGAPVEAWQRHRESRHPGWSWERGIPLVAPSLELPALPPATQGAAQSDEASPAAVYQPDMIAVVQTLRERHDIGDVDEFSDPLEVVQAIDRHFGANDEAGLRLLLRLLHPYDAADILLGWYEPRYVLARLARPLMERFSLLFAPYEDNAIQQWVLCYFLQKHGWIPQDNWRHDGGLELPHLARPSESLGLPRRMDRFFQQFHRLPTGKQAKRFDELVAHWEELGRHYHLCCSLRPGHLSHLVEKGYGAFQRDAIPMYPSERQEAWFRDRLLRWTLRSLVSWPPHWFGALLRKDAAKLHRLGLYMGAIFHVYGRLDEMRARLQEEYHWLLKGS